MKSNFYFYFIKGFLSFLSVLNKNIKIYFKFINFLNILICVFNAIYGINHKIKKIRLSIVYKYRKGKLFFWIIFKINDIL